MSRAFIVLIFLALCTTIFADGKVFIGEDVNPEIPYQRALIMFEDQTETLILQSKYSIDLSAGSDGLDIGWVVPVPAVPELASMSADDADELFWNLALYTHPHLVDISSKIKESIGIILALSSVVLLFMSILGYLSVNPFLIKKRLTFLVMSFCCLMITFAFLPTLSRAKELGESIEVLDHKTVGIYDVSVIRSDIADDIIAWLNDNEFKFDQQDKEVFNAYIDQGWCFVVANLKSGMGVREKTEAVSDEGLAAPLILRFPISEPVYPMALTGTGGFDTEVLVYLISEKQLICDQLELKYASYSSSVSWRLKYSYLYGEDALLDIEPKDFFKDLEPELGCTPCLAKFKSILMPDQMKDDIVFRPSDTPIKFRETIFQR